MNEHWSKIKENSAGYYRIYFLLIIYKLFGWFVLRFFLYPVVFFIFLFSASIRQFSLKYLNKLYQFKLSQNDFSFNKPNLISVYKHILSFAEALVDKIVSWSGYIKIDCINIKTEETFNDFLENLKQNKGVFIICSHLGNIEVFRALINLNKKALNQEKLIVNVIMQTNHSEVFNKVLNSQNSQTQTNLIAAGDIGIDTVINLQEKINKGEMIVIAGDRTSATNQERVLESNFLGDMAYAFPLGTFTLAVLLESPIYFLFALKEKDFYNLYIFKSQNDFSQKRKQQIKIIFNEYVQYLQKLCLQYPYQWYNFFDFWKKS